MFVMNYEEIKLDNMSKEELMQLRKELAGRRASIDHFLDNQAYSRSSNIDTDELVEEADICEEFIKKIDSMLSIRKR